MSLKETLYKEIRERGVVPYEQIISICLEEGAKISAGERRLRELMVESPVEPIMKRSKKGTNYIAAYKYKEPIKPTQPKQLCLN